MRKKIISIAILIFSLMGLATLFAVPTENKIVPIQNASSISIENEKINVCIAQNGAIIHNIVFKEFIQKDKSAVVLRDHSNYKNCFEVLYPEIVNQPRGIVWKVNNKTKSSVELVGQHGNTQIIRNILLDEYQIKIQDKKNNSNFLRQNILLSGDGSMDSNFFVMNNSVVTLPNRNIVPSLFNFYKNPNKKLFLEPQNHKFGMIYNDNYLISVQLTEEAVVNYTSDQKNVGLQCYRTVSDKNNTLVITAIPTQKELLKKYGLTGCRSYGWFPFFSKPLCLTIDYLTKRFNSLGFVFFLLFVLLMYSVFLYEETRKRRKHELMRAELKLAEEQLKHDKNLLWQEQRKITKKYGGLSPMSIIAPFCMIFLMYYTTQYAIYYCFYLKFCKFLWIKDISLPDSCYLLNLFGRLSIDLPGYLRIGILPLISNSISILSMDKILNDKNGMFHVSNNVKVVLWILGAFIMKNIKSANLIMLSLFFVINPFMQYLINKKNHELTV